MNMIFKFIQILQNAQIAVMMNPCVWLLLICCGFARSAERPNIIVIVADDLGWNDVSFHGSNQIPTPNIDKLAYEGIILNNYYVSPICTPTRGALMSGRHPIHTGLQHSVIFASQRYGLPLEEKIMPQWFQELGYRTHMVGKWHLGFYAEEFTPLYRGFESHFGYLLGHGDYFDHMAECTPVRYVWVKHWAAFGCLSPFHFYIIAKVGNASAPIGYAFNMFLSCKSIFQWHLGMFAEEYLPTFRGFESHYGYYQGCEDYYDHTYEADLAYWGLDWRRNLDLLRNETNLYSTDLFTAEAVNIIRNHNTSEPLYLYLPHQAVHSGNTGGDPLQAPQHYVDRFPHINNYHRRLFAGMVAALDDSVGAVVKTLKDQGMYDNTVIMFTTDNGGPANGFDANAANNFPLRGMKVTQWEGGVRGTGFISSPLLNQSGYVSNHMLHVCDWLPTLYTAAGGDASVMKNLDGQSEWDSLTNNKAGKRQEILHNIDPSGKGQMGLRVGDYKIVVGDIGMALSDWYPPWAKPSDSEMLHANNSAAFKMFGGKNGITENESPIEKRLQQNLKHFEHAVAENMGMGGDFDFEILESNIDSNIESELKFETYRMDFKGLQSKIFKKPLKNTMKSYYHKNHPVKVECGRKPFNASTNCDPRVSPCLFNIANDPCEYNNIAVDNKDMVIQLLLQLQQYEDTMVPPLNTPVDPAGNPKYHDGAWVPWVKL
ncbi:ARSB-like protein [Mya arenaria]|uniref:ARSB-like protein n=1 Tax=Mya arenaria TaxID=6604 RepID=A0ABY7EAH7_MYAAR|nr:ARSB-like protein [Mya arenaria]